ncbi:MAG TPA: hypothetical protein VHN99_05900 [Deinococcales bacterium]|nr:hypothetical protein [Deinococcales bacterium]
MGAAPLSLSFSTAPTDPMPAGEAVPAFIARASRQVVPSKKPPYRPYERLFLEFIDDAGRRASLYRPAFLDLSDLTGALGLPETGLKHGEDLLALSGTPVTLSVVHNPGGNGVTYANVTAINGRSVEAAAAR